jgi:alanyl-tRNA synthetase
VILNKPISPVRLTWIPPQSSIEKFFSSIIEPIASEGGVAAGVRRIEAVTGTKALDVVQKTDADIQHILEVCQFLIELFNLLL